MTLDLLIRIFLLIVHTIVQHETAIVHWYWWLEPGLTVFQTSILVLFIVTVVDFVWLYFLFYIVGKFIRLFRRFRWVNSVGSALRKSAFGRRLLGFFGDSRSADPQTAKSSTPVKRRLENLGYTGILIIGTVPLPSFKELGIALSFTPRFRKHGFLFMILGGILKTIGTILFYLGIDRFIRWF